MTVYCNEKELSVEAQTTLFAVLEQAGYSSQPGIAVAVNSSVVPRAQWHTYELVENAKVLVIQATKGG